MQKSNIIKHTLLAAVAFSCLLASCNGRSQGQDVTSNDIGDTLRLDYAQYLRMIEHEGYTEVILENPWKKGFVLHRYYLVPKGAKGDDAQARLAVDENADVVRTPIGRSIVFTSPHCQLMYELGCEKAISGVCDKEFIHIADLQRQGRVVDCGQGMQPMIEKIVDLKPEAMLVSPYENSGGYGKLAALGIPIIETADYMETSPLGRAEWMKFYGKLFGCELRADSLFHVVDSTYQALRQMASMLPKGRTILTERKTGSVWYAPGGKSTIGVMLADAHAGYPWGEDKHSGSLALSAEQVIDHASEIEVWAFKYMAPNPMSRADLLQEYAGYRQLQAFQKGEIYECNTIQVAYFEQIGFHPEILLRDFIILAHPWLNIGELRFYRKINL